MADKGASKSKLKVCSSGDVESEVKLQAGGGVKVRVGLEADLTSTSPAKHSVTAVWPI
jgi:hypothetical protein